MNRKKLILLLSNLRNYQWISFYLSFKRVLAGKEFILLIFFPIFIVVMSSCSKPKSKSVYLNLVLKSDPTTLDPAYVVDESAMITAKVFNGLVKFGKNMEIIPDIAKKWEISDDGKKYLFYIRNDVTFNNRDGKQRNCTAEDVKYSFERILSPESLSPREWLFNMVEGSEDFKNGIKKEISGIRVIGKYKLEINLSNSFAPFLNFLCMPAAYIVPKEEVEKWGKDFASNISGTGPFILKEWKSGEKIVLVKNDKYFDSIPRVDGIIYRILRESFTRITEFKNGNIDILPIWSDEIDRFDTDKRWKKNVITSSTLSVHYLGINCQKPPFNDVRIRKALNYAIDKERIIKDYAGGRFIVSKGPIPPSLPGYNKERQAYSYDPEMAKKLLEEAGLKKGIKMKLWHRSERDALQKCEVLQAYFNAVGIKTELVPVDFSALKEAINRGEADVFYLAWLGDYPDAENFLAPLFHSKNWGAGGNRARFKNEKVDELIEEAQKTIDENKRIELYKKIESIIFDYAPWVFLWHQVDYTIIQDGIRNFKLFPIYNADKGEKIEKVVNFK